MELSKSGASGSEKGHIHENLTLTYEPWEIVRSRSDNTVTGFIPYTKKADLLLKVSEIQPISREKVPIYMNKLSIKKSTQSKNFKRLIDGIAN